jgi:hypothetical protein
MKNLKKKISLKKKSTELRTKVFKTQINSLQKEYDRISKLLLKQKDLEKNVIIINNLKLYKEDIEFQINILQEKLKKPHIIKINKKYGRINQEIVSSPTFDLLTIQSPLGNFKELTQQQEQAICDNLNNLVAEEIDFNIKAKEENKDLDLIFLSNKNFLNKYMTMTEKTVISEYIKVKALLLIKESQEYGYLFQEVNEYSVLNEKQTKILDQLIFELKSNLSIENIEKENQPYYELFKRILRFLERDNTLKHIKETLPKPFLNLLLAKTEEYKEEERIEYIIITTISIISNAFSKVTYRSYLDLCLLIGEQLLLLLNPTILLKQLDKIGKKTTNINIQQQVRETLDQYSKTITKENPLKVMYNIGNLMIISFIKLDLLSVVFQEELVREYDKEFSWYKGLTSEQKNQYLKELNLPKTGNLLYMGKLKEIVEKIPTIKFLYAYNLPSTIKPISYHLDNKNKTVNYGGFLSNELLHRFPLVKKDPQQRTLTVLKQEFLDARNYLQEIPFSISIKNLFYMIALYKQKTLFQSTDDVVKQAQVLYSLEVALHLLIKNKENSFYAPIDVDFRARIYEICTLLSYQGPDICRMLFTTPDSYVLDQKTIKLLISLCSIYYNKAYRKKDFLEQLKFFKENIHLIHKTGYICDFNKLNHLNKKYEFVKLCILIRDLKFFEQLPTNSLGKSCDMLISLDAKSSGLQLISLLSNSRSLCEKVNIIENKEETEDIYSYVAEKINTFITINLTEYCKKYPHYLFFNNKKERIFYGRNIWKKIIMIKGYAAGKDKLLTTFQIALLEQYPHIKETDLNIQKADIEHFFFKILAYLNKLLPEISTFLNLCFLISSSALKNKIPLKWKTLNKTAEITHTYNEVKETRYYSSYNSRVMQLNVNLYQKDTFAKKNKWAFPANLIQSCDATLLECILYEAKKQNITITCTAHDCILIKMSDYQKIQDLISIVIKNLFTYENIQDFWNQFRQYIDIKQLKRFDKLTNINKNQFEKLIDEVSRNKTLFVLG